MLLGTPDSPAPSAGLGLGTTLGYVVYEVHLPTYCILHEKQRLG